MAEVSLQISNAVVALFAEHTGRGATRARTYVSDNLIVVMLEDSLTRGERTLMSSGRNEVVALLRQNFQEALRDEMVEIVERLTGRNVRAFMSSNNLDPDYAIESFVLDLKNGLPESKHEENGK